MFVLEFPETVVNRVGQVKVKELCIQAETRAEDMEFNLYVWSCVCERVTACVLSAGQDKQMD